jgi:hypothetical protein
LREAVRAASRCDHTPEWPQQWVISEEASLPEPF